MIVTDAVLKSPVFEKADLLLKVGSAALAFFYICGLLVNNLQLMELGISDFASLRSRNIMTGTVFFLYVLIFLFSL